MTAGFDRVTLRVEDEGAVVIRMVLGTKARLAVVLAAGLDRRLVEGVDRLARLCREGDMSAGAGLGLAPLGQRPIQNFGASLARP
jgi:hypothetical protein